MTLRIATRGSALALAQAGLVADAMARSGVDTQLVVVTTDGDRRAADTAWGEGAFVTAIEEALLEGRAELAVHSAKDMPTSEDPRLAVAAYLPRSDPRDALVVRGSGPGTLATLPPGTRVGTDSPRRSHFGARARADVAFEPLHGNVDTRLRRLDEGEVDALVLAVAGLMRLGRAERIAEHLDPAVMPPAPGQGALAVQARADDDETLALAARLDDLPTRQAVEAERAFLRAAGGGCRSPIGALAEVTADGRLTLLGALVDHRSTMLGSIDGDAGDAIVLASTLVARLRDAERRPRVIVTRPVDQAADLVAMLRSLDLEPVVVPAIATVPIGAAFASGLADDIATTDWVVVSSANGARAIVEAIGPGAVSAAEVRWVAVGDRSADVLREAGVTEVWVPSQADGRSLGRELPLGPEARILVVRGSLADATLPDDLARRGATVTTRTAYATVEGPESSRSALTAALEDDPAALVFASGSAIRGTLVLAGPSRHAQVLAVPAVCIGPATAAVAREHGFRTISTSPTPSPGDLARTTCDAVVAPTMAVS